MGTNRVAILGMNVYLLTDVPWDDDTIEKWGINEGYMLFTEEEMSKVDRWFQLHPPWDYKRKVNKSDPEHDLWMRRKHPFPVYMKKAYKSVPTSVAYPIEEIVDFFGRSYFTCTFAYQIALALYEGASEIQLYGLEMLAPTEIIEDQRGCVEYWCGRAEGMGVTVTVPPTARLLGQFHKLYALEKKREIHRHHIESMRNRAEMSRRDHLSIYLSEADDITDEDKGYAKRYMDVYLGKTMAAQELLDELDDIRYGDRKEMA